MEPITTTAAISAVVTYLAKKLKDNESVQAFFNDFSDATVNWIRPIFIKQDGTPKDAIAELQQKPDSSARQDAVKSALNIALEDNPQSENWLREMMKQIQQKDPDFVKGAVINQYHTGSGDNIGGNKITYSK